MSATNSVNLVGRLLGDVKTIENKDKSTTVLGSIAVRRSYQNTVDGKKQTLSDRIPFRHRVPAKVQGAGSWDRTGQGDLIAIEAEIQAIPYTDDKGQTQYPVTIEVTSFPTFLESATVTAARRANKAAGATAAPAEDAAAVSEGYEGAENGPFAE